MVNVGDECYISATDHVLFQHIGTVEACDHRGNVTLNMVERHGERIILRVHTSSLRVITVADPGPTTIRYLQEGTGYLQVTDNLQFEVELLSNDDDVMDDSDRSEQMIGTCPVCVHQGPLGNLCLNRDCGDDTGTIYG